MDRLELELVSFDDILLTSLDNPVHFEENNNNGPSLLSMMEVIALNNLLMK
jgi:hypothetical protein